MAWVQTLDEKVSYVLAVAQVRGKGVKYTFW